MVSSNIQRNLDVFRYALEVCNRVKGKGVHSPTYMQTAGFQYTGEGDTVRCASCYLEVSEWDREMDPFRTHLERSPQCPFVQSIQSKNESMLIDAESSAKRHKPDSEVENLQEMKKPLELAILKRIRQRTFSHWPKHTTLIKDQMIEAGFFQCNVGDRVICIYCNLICQQWDKDVDDPVQVHKTLSPKCPYVLFVLNLNGTSPAFVLNDVSADTTRNQATLLKNIGRLQSDPIVLTNPCHAGYASVVKRQATFDTWTAQLSPSVDDLVQAGFFYTGMKNIVTCFYCNGSLQNWGKSDKPLTEHIRWFPHCPYAKQLSGDELHSRIRMSQRARQDRETAQASTDSVQTASTQSSVALHIIDENMLSRLVAARLDLAASQRLLNQNFKLSIIKRCWEDQLRIKNDDFASDGDLHIACLILQKQIEYINGNKDNITIPSRKMKSLQQNEQSDNSTSQQSSGTSSSTSLSAQTSSASAPTVTASLQPVKATVTDEQPATEETIPQSKTPLNNPCLSCDKEEKRLACIPCGHLAICVNCSQKLRTCPVCRRAVEAFVRIYI